MGECNVRPGWQWSSGETGTVPEHEIGSTSAGKAENESEQLTGIEVKTEQETGTQKQIQKMTEAPKAGTTGGGSTPKTGDNTNIWLWLFLLTASALLLSKEALRRGRTDDKK